MAYLIEDGVSAESLLARLAAHLHCRCEPETEVESVCFDTTDQAVLAAGGLLFHRGRALIWHSVSDSDGCLQATEQAPSRACDLADGPVKSRIAAVARDGALHPSARIRTLTRALRLMDAQDRATALLILHVHHCEDLETGRDAALRLRLEVEAVPGGGPAPDLAPILAKLGLRLEEAQLPVFTEALAAIERLAMASRESDRGPIGPKTRADKATRQVLLDLLSTLERNVEGARLGEDHECLHDLRVATRRIRAVLAQVRGVLPDAVVAELKAGFAWVQRVTGPVRDLDVHLLALESQGDAIAPSLVSSLEPLRAFLATRRESEQGVLAAILGERRFRDLLRRCRQQLESPSLADPAPPNADRPIKAVIDRRVRRLAKRVRREVRAIREDSPAEELHELRKSCKKMRYILELYKDLYPPSDLKPLIRQLKTMLDALGAFQDLSVQARHLEESAAQMAAEQKSQPDTLIAAGALIGRLLAQQQEARAKVDDVNATFGRACAPWLPD